MFTLRPLYPRGQSPRYPLNRRLGWFLGYSGRGEQNKNHFTLLGVEPRLLGHPARSSFRLILVVAETRECVCVCWYYCSVSSHCWHAGLPISRCQPLTAAAFLPQPAVPICLRTNSLSVLPILELFRARFMLKH
jgi:hypothetical protein